MENIFLIRQIAIPITCIDSAFYWPGFGPHRY